MKLLSVFALALAMRGQSSSFEVASIKPYRELGGPSSIRASVGRIRMDNVSLRKLTLWAYGIPDDREYALVGPEWMGSERFIIEATFPASSSPDQVRHMTQTLLAERFKLATHRETRELPMYTLVADRNGAKIQPTEAGAGSTNGGLGKLEATKIPMQKLADLLARITGHQVVEATGLKGVYNFKLEWTPDEAASAADPGLSLLSALREQLGLRLEGRKGPVDVLVVDHIERAPTEN
jgi:uncharacterized protein (TIGR03435 family)